jgi:hypothetical protein
MEKFDWDPTAGRDSSCRAPSPRFARGHGVTKTVRYSLVADGRVRPLAGVQWADWGHDGRLLLATTGGRLQIADHSAEAITVAWEVDLAPLVPDPSPPPALARRW